MKVWPDLMYRRTVSVQSSRRGFVKVVLASAAFSGLAPFRCLGKGSAKMSPSGTPANGEVKLSFADFPELGQINGSVIVNVPGTGGSMEPLIVSRGTGNAFYAVSSICTHQSCPVSTYKSSSGGLLCACHGSLYGVDGHVLRGPATRPLPTYATKFDGQSTVSVFVPGVAYVISGKLILAPSGQRRFQLDFPTSDGQTYRVLFSPSLESAATWSQVSFALAPDGPANQESIIASATSEGV